MFDADAFPIARLSRDACLIAVRGELDGSTAWRLQDALGAAAATSARLLIADMGAVTYLDADALAVLSFSASQIHRAGRRLVIVTDDAWLVRLLDAGDLEGMAHVQPTLRDVVRDLHVLTAAE